MPEPAHTRALDSDSATPLLDHPGTNPGSAVCPYFHAAVELVGKRWTGAIVGALIPGPHRFSELAHAIPQISDRLLSTRLRELESAGIVEREVLDGSPVRVLYTLTLKGLALEPAVSELRLWAQQWLKSQ